MSDTSHEPGEVRIPARLRYVSAVRGAVQELCRRAGLGPEETSDLLLAVSEACNNAIQHGARGVPDAEIVVRLQSEPGVAQVEVHDPGTGFDPGDLWDPQSEVSHGRGMLLMMQLTDKLEYATDGQGTTVRLSKHSRAAEDAEGIAGRRSRRLRYVFDVCRTVSGTLELPLILSVVAERTAQLFAVARARVLLHDPRRQTATVVASWGERLRIYPPQQKPPATRQAVYVAGEKTTVGDLAAHPGRHVPGRIVRSSISVPITSRGEVVGSIHLDSFRRPRRFSRSDVTALRAIAAQAAVAIENARLYREAQRHVEELGALSEVANALNASLDLDHTLRTVLDKTRDVLGVTVCAVMLLDEEGYLNVRASYGMSSTYVSHQRARLEDSPLGRAITERRVIATWDLRAYDEPRGLFEGVVSAAAAPMLVEDRAIGTLSIYTRERYRFTEDQLRVLKALADHGALAVHNARLYEASEKARAQLEASAERAGSALHAARELQDVVRLVAELAAQALAMDGGALLLTDTGLLAVSGVHAGTRDLPAPGCLKELAEAVASREEALTLADLPEGAGRAACRAAGVASALAVPVTTAGGLQGALCVYGRTARAFGARDLALLKSFATQAAMLIENQCLLHEAHLRAEELGTLLEVGQSVVSKLDLEQVLRQIIQHVSRLLAPEVCSILLLDRHSGALQVAAAQGLEEQAASGLRLPQAEGVIGAVLRDGQTRAVADIRRHPEFVYQEVSEEQRLRAFLCVPLATAKGVLGVLNVYRATAHRWSDAEIKFLSALGTQAAIAIENATLYQEERQVTQALQKAFVPEHRPPTGGLDIGQVYQPAGEHAEVGGDYYDFVPLSGERLGIVIADVSGKGLRAATGTALGKYLLRAYVLEDPAPGQAVQRANRALCAQLEEETTFLSLFYALWDPASRCLTYVNAGHPYPLLWRATQGGCIALRSSATMLLGVVPDQTFAEQQVSIHPGDVLLTYTDGVIEARQGMEQFGMDRLEHLLGELAHEPAQAIADGIYAAMRAFSDGTPSDDVTLVVVKF